MILFSRVVIAVVCWFCFFISRNRWILLTRPKCQSINTFCFQTCAQPLNTSGSESHSRKRRATDNSKGRECLTTPKRIDSRWVLGRSARDVLVLLQSKRAPCRSESCRTNECLVWKPGYCKKIAKPGDFVTSIGRYVTRAMDKRNPR